MKYTTNRKANVCTIAKLKNNEGLTFRYGKIVEYKTGWQVATNGIEVKTAQEVSEILHSPSARRVIWAYGSPKVSTMWISVGE